MIDPGCVKNWIVIHSKTRNCLNTLCDASLAIFPRSPYLDQGYSTRKDSLLKSYLSVHVKMYIFLQHSPFARFHCFTFEQGLTCTQYRRLIDKYLGLCFDIINHVCQQTPMIKIFRKNLICPWICISSGQRCIVDTKSCWIDVDTTLLQRHVITNFTRWLVLSALLRGHPKWAWIFMFWDWQPVSSGYISFEVFIRLYYI